MVEASITKAIQIETYEIRSKDNADFWATIHYKDGIFNKVETHFREEETSEHWFFLARVAEFIESLNSLKQENALKQEQDNKVVASDSITLQHVNGPDAYACIEDIKGIFKHHRKSEKITAEEMHIFTKIEDEVESILEDLPMN